MQFCRQSFVLNYNAFVYRCYVIIFCCYVTCLNVILHLKVNIKKGIRFLIAFKCRMNKYLITSMIISYFIAEESDSQFCLSTSGRETNSFSPVQFNCLKSLQIIVRNFPIQVFFQNFIMYLNSIKKSLSLSLSKYQMKKKYIGILNYFFKRSNMFLYSENFGYDPLVYLLTLCVLITNVLKSFDFIQYYYKSEKVVMQKAYCIYFLIIRHVQ